MVWKVKTKLDLMITNISLFEKKTDLITWS